MDDFFYLIVDANRVVKLTKKEVTLLPGQKALPIEFHLEDGVFEEEPFEMVIKSLKKKIIEIRLRDDNGKKTE